MEIQEKKWYQKKRYIIPITAFSIFTAFGLFFDDSNISTQVKDAGTQTISQPQLQQQNTPAVITETQKVEEAQTPAAQSQINTTPKQGSPQLSNDNYYNNVEGNNVHSPAYTSDNSVPAGASARCGDGTYSFSQNRRGTCSRHGGVAQWY